MKLFLPKLFAPILFGIALLFLSLFYAPFASAQTPTPSSIEGRWVSDQEVTFVGKTGARSGQFLDWALQNYQWLTLVNGQNPLIPFWITIRNIVYAVLALFILATAFILIITRGQSITVMRFIPRFVFIVILITLSFSIVQFIYQINDIIQNFFLRVEDRFISTQDLLYIGFDYETFTGFRRVGLQFEESAFISLLLVRLTAITYYVMTGLLLVRKIILWFFIILSPVFPLLIFYRPIRNTAKIWVGEFFRWLFYAPLFAVFLKGLVVMWRTGIPLPFDFSQVGTIVYPTAINILLGGPGQTIGINNSVNLRDTFALYVVALLMLWVAILLPFLLLKIFLDYLASLSFDNSIFVKQFMNRNLNFLSPSKGGPSAPPPAPPGSLAPTGVARALPFLRKGAGVAVEPVKFHATIQASVQESADILRLTDLSIPRMRDIARYEVSSISSDISKRSEVSTFHTTLQKIANPASVSTVTEREKFTTVRQKLLEQKQKGNPIATSIINATQVTSSSVQNLATNILNTSQISTTGIQSRQEQINNMSHALSMVANPEKATFPAEKEKFVSLREQLIHEKEKGNTLASSILETSEKISKAEIVGDQRATREAALIEELLTREKREKAAGAGTPLAGPHGVVRPHEVLPIVNKVQQVSVEDYEEVRKLWTENYHQLSPPKDLSGQEADRETWIKNDIDRVNQAIVLLTSSDQAKVNEGMEMVANILPFLLIGGFSKSEVTAYLKAKMQAGKSVLEELLRKREEEETKISAVARKKEEKKEMAEEANVEEPKENPDNTKEAGEAFDKGEADKGAVDKKGQI